MQTKQKQMMQAYTKLPLPLTPDNFTPLSRTPWGGPFITEQLKDRICPNRIGEKVGESWDFSFDPSFPSVVLGSSVTLKEMVESFPIDLLSAEFWKEQGTNAGCELLVKVLAAAEDLSVQVHPDDADPFLKADECGKFEA